MAGSSADLLGALTFTPEVDHFEDFMQNLHRAASGSMAAKHDLKKIVNLNNNILLLERDVDIINAERQRQNPTISTPKSAGAPAARALAFGDGSPSGAPTPWRGRGSGEPRQTPTSGAGA